MSRKSDKSTEFTSVTASSYSASPPIERKEGVNMKIQLHIHQSIIGLHSMRGERAIINDEPDKPISLRQQEEMKQDEIRTCLRSVINDCSGTWFTARGLADLSKTKFPHLAETISGKSVSEYLKTMHLRTKKVMTTLYLCERQYDETSP